jgi:cyclopropane-fatty-acyl-phospholipid synthase
MNPDSPSSLTVDFENIQAHYVLSEDFFKLYLDPTMTYSCAYFPTGNETLEEAQLAKLDLSLGKLKLKPGECLLDIGCGWGSTARLACEKHWVTVVGLTLSNNKFEYAKRLAGGQDGLEFRLEGWEDSRSCMQTAYVRTVRRHLIFRLTTLKEIGKRRSR